MRHSQSEHSAIDKAWDDLLAERAKSEALERKVKELEKTNEQMRQRIIQLEQLVQQNGAPNGEVTITLKDDLLKSDSSPEYEVSQNVLVLTPSHRPKLESLSELIKRIYGPGFTNPYSESDREKLMLSVTTAQSIAEQIRSMRLLPRSDSMSSDEMRLFERTEAAYRIIDLLCDKWTTHRSFKALDGDVDYINLLIALCSKASNVLSQDSMLLKLTSPTFVMGDIHGSYQDLAFFLDNLVPFRFMRYTAAPLLFLGDYVDRGADSVEVAAMLLSMKCMSPTSVYLLRGNHECQEVNSDTIYGDNSFMAQCCNRFGEEKGSKIHRAFNAAFAQMPLAAVIDNKIFCVHGGIPKPEKNETFLDSMKRLQDPRFPRRTTWSVPLQPPQVPYKNLALGLLWSDPAPPLTQLDELGFGPNELRGEHTYTFGRQAEVAFSEQTGYQYIIRAHEVKQQGLRLCHNGRMITVFTSSHYCGGHNGAGAVYVDKGKIRLITVLPEEQNDK